LQRVSSIMLAVVCTLVALLVAGLSFRRLAVARGAMSTGEPLLARLAVGMLWVCVCCCAITCVLFICMAWYNIAARGLEGAIEGSLASRYALYTALGAYLLTALEAPLLARARRAWRLRGPRLLPPAPDDL
jgi:hypothetical protein